jgi:hypothetical protein
VPSVVFSEPTAGERPKRWRKYREQPADCRRNGLLQAFSEKQEDGGKHQGNEHASGKALQNPEHDERDKIKTESAADGSQRESENSPGKEPANGEDADEQSGQRNRYDFGNEIGRLHPAHAVRTDFQRVFNDC